MHGLLNVDWEFKETLCELCACLPTPRKLLKKVLIHFLRSIPIEIVSALYYTIVQYQGISIVSANERLVRVGPLQSLRGNHRLKLDLAESVAPNAW